MTHLDDGMLRRLVDEPFAVPESSRRHYDTCPRCRVRQERIASDAWYAEQTLKLAPDRVDPAAALHTVRARIDAQGIGQASPRAGIARRWRTRLTAPLAAVATSTAIIGALVLTPAGSLAQDFITIFQPAQIAAVEVTSADLHDLRGLSKYGNVQVPAISPPHNAASAAQASSDAGIDVLTPTPGTTGLPTESPRYQVIPGGTASFTFSATKATANGASAMPAGIDGSTLQVTIKTAVLTQYGAVGGIPDLVLAEMPAPVVQSTGVSVKQLEDYVLSLPEVSPQLADQLRAINDPTSTLPVPIPVNLAHGQSVQVQGVTGLEVGDNTGLGSGVIWEKNHIIYGVAAPLPEDQVLGIANSLR